MVDGVASGAFVPKAADASSGFLISSCLTPCSQRPHSLLVDVLLAPWFVLLHWLIKGQIERKTLAIFGRRARPSQRSLTAWLLPLGVVLVAICCFWGVNR